MGLREARFRRFGVLIVEYQEKIYEHGNNSLVPRTKIWFTINNIGMTLHYLCSSTMILNIEAAVNFKIILIRSSVIISPTNFLILKYDHSKTDV